MNNNSIAAFAAIASLLLQVPKSDIMQARKAFYNDLHNSRTISK